MLQKLSMSYSVFTLMKDSLTMTDDIIFLYDEFSTEFSMIHSAMVLVISAPSYRVDSEDRFRRLFTYKQNKGDAEGSDEDKSSEEDKYDNTMVFVKGLHNRERMILETFISFIQLKSQKNFRTGRRSPLLVTTLRGSNIPETKRS